MAQQSSIHSLLAPLPDGQFSQSQSQLQGHSFAVTPHCMGQGTLRRLENYNQVSCYFLPL